MAHIIKIIKEMLHTFPYIVTGVLFATAFFITFFNGEDARISAELLWQILITAFLCVWGNLLYYCKMLAKRQVLCRILHYIYINIVVFVCADVFYWYDVGNIKMSGFMFLSIAIVFGVVSYCIWHKSSKMVALLNRRLEKYQNKRTEL